MAVDILEVLKAVGVDAGDKAEALKLAHAQAEEADVEPLKRTIEAVRGEKKAEQEAKIAAIAEAEQAKIDAMQKAGDIDGLKASFKAREDALKAEADAIREAANNDKIDAALSRANSAVESHFAPDSLTSGRRFLRGMVNGAIGEDGKAVVSYSDVDGNPIADEVAFVEYLSNNKDAAHFMSGTASGVGGTGSSINVSGGGVDKNAAFKERLRKAGLGN